MGRIKTNTKKKQQRNWELKLNEETVKFAHLLQKLPLTLTKWT